MADDMPTFRTGVIRPVECLKEGWQLVKGQYWLFLGITFVGSFIGGVVPIVLAGPMMCGIYLCLLRRARGRPVKFEMLFKGFDYFVPSLVATLLMMIPILVVLIPGYVAVIATLVATMPKGGNRGPSGAFWAAYAAFMLVLLFVSIAVSVLCFFIYPLIADRKLSGVQAIKTSLRAVRANLGGVIGLVLLNALLTMLGLLACYVGAIFVMPIHFAAVAVAYRQVFPDEDREVTDKKQEYSEEEKNYDDNPDIDALPPT